MHKLFSTEDVHPRDRFAYWHEVARAKFIGHDAVPESRLAFEATIQAGEVSDIGIVEFENAPVAFVRAARHISKTGDDAVLVLRQNSGAQVLERNGCEVLLESGDVAVFDPVIPYKGRSLPGSGSVILKVPRRALEARAGGVADHLICINRSHPECAFASSFLAVLPTHAAGMRAAAQDLVREQTLDLLAVALARTMEATRPRLSSARALALTRIRGAIEARLMDPQLDSAAVAKAAGISVRYANAVLAREGTSVRRLVQERRLERCRKALGDTMHAHRTVSQIAFAWGFSDLTHFSRSFRAAYGMLPSEYRRLTRDVSGATPVRSAP